METVDGSNPQPEIIVLCLETRTHWYMRSKRVKGEKTEKIRNVQIFDGETGLELVPLFSPLQDEKLAEIGFPWLIPSRAVMCLCCTYTYPDKLSSLTS